MQGHTLSHLSYLEKGQWMGVDELAAVQQNKLENLVLHAAKNVPYYRELFAAKGLAFDKAGGLMKEFVKIPFLDKEILSRSFDALKSEKLNQLKWFENKSGGSTGEPVRFIQDKVYSDWGEANKLLDDQWSGYTVGDKQVLLWGSERDLFVGKETAKIRLRRFARNEICLNAFRMNTDRMSEYIKAINQRHPDRIFAYANSIYELSCFIKRNDLKIVPPKAIKVTGGNLFPHMRKKIELVFQAPIFNCYGSRELGDIACECDNHNGLHVMALTHLVEILKPDGTPASPGETGEIVITSLTNLAMPFIRYRIGDMGVWSEYPCGCGRQFPLIKKVVGRMTDAFVKKDGGIVTPEYIIHLVGVVLNTGWILKYQVIQEAFDRVRILIVPLSLSEPENEYREQADAIADKIKLVMGAECRVEFEFVDDIPPSASGKYRYTISRVNDAQV